MSGRMSRDRRDSYRFEVEEGEVYLCLGPRAQPYRVFDLSAGGGGIVSPADLIEEFAPGPVVLHTGEYPPFELKIVPVRSTEAAGLSRVGVRFEGMDHKALRHLSGYLVDRFLEQSRELQYPFGEPGLSIGSFQRNLVNRLLRFHAISRGQNVRVYRGDLVLPLALRVTGLTVEAARQLIVAEVVNGSTGILERGEEYTFVFSGANSLNCFRTGIWRVDSRRISILLPPDIRQAGFRQSFRTKLTAGQLLEVVFQHPRMPGLLMLKPVLDVSAWGFSFPLDVRQDMLSPGERLGQVSIRLPGGPARVEAAIRSIAAERGSARLTCGAEILGFLDRWGAERWRQFVFHLGHARLRLGKKALVEDAWKVLESSGYVALVDESRRHHLRRSFLDSWDKHVRKPRASRFFLLLKGDRPVGTAAASLLYPGTWMAHHFGIDEKERLEDKSRLFDFAREIYSGIMFLLGHMASLEYFIFYFDSVKTFHERAFGQFLRRYPAKEDFIYDGFKLYSCIPRLDRIKSSAGGRNRLEICGGDRKLLNMLSIHLRSHLPPIEFEAFRYDEKEITLQRFSRACAAKGYERERHILFALEDERPLAALIAETGDEGLNIFSLFNKCWLVYLDPRAAQDDQVKALLLNEAVKLYAGKRKKKFLMLTKPDEGFREQFEDLGFSFVADGLRWLGRSSIVPAYINYFDELMGMAKTLGS